MLRSKTLHFLSPSLCCTLVALAVFLGGPLPGLVQCAEKTAEKIVNVRETGAKGDGLADDTAAIQRALDGGGRTVVIPAGTYKISSALLLDSATTVKADEKAVIRLADHAGNDVNLFLLTNRDRAQGNKDITVEGGIWDGNNEHNTRGLKEQMPCYTGVAINFIRVRGLVLRNLVVRNPDAYAIRACHLEDFVMENLGFDFSSLRMNQDGVHLDGFCQRGVIRNLKALSPFATNDDMVALNADDGSAAEYVIQQGMVPGPIRDITVEHLRAESAFTFVRILSHKELIENVTISDVVGGCRFYAVNMDRWRFPEGGGNIRNVTLRDFTIRKMSDGFSQQRGAGQRPLIHIETAVKDLSIENFNRPSQDEKAAPTLVLDNGRKNSVRLEGLTAEQAAELKALSPALTPAMFVAGGEGARKASSMLQMEATAAKVTLPGGGFSRLHVNDAGEASTRTPKSSATKPQG